MANSLNRNSKKKMGNIIMRLKKRLLEMFLNKKLLMLENDKHSLSKENEEIGKELELIEKKIRIIDHYKQLNELEKEYALGDETLNEKIAELKRQIKDEEEELSKKIPIITLKQERKLTYLSTFIGGVILGIVTIKSTNVQTDDVPQKKYSSEAEEFRNNLGVKITESSKFEVSLDDMLYYCSTNGIPVPNNLSKLSLEYDTGDMSEEDMNSKLLYLIITDDECAKLYKRVIQGKENATKVSDFVSVPIKEILEFEGYSK